MENLLNQNLGLPQRGLTQREKRLREKKNVSNENSVGSASRRAFIEWRKTKINLFFYFYADWPSSWVDYIERKRLGEKD